MHLVSVVNLSDFWNVDTYKSNHPGIPSTEFSKKHRRGKSETLRAQYINTKDVRFGSVRSHKFLDLPVVVYFSLFHLLIDYS